MGDSSRGRSLVCNGASAGQRGHRPPGLYQYHPVFGVLDHTRIILIIIRLTKSEVSNHGGESVLLLTSFLIHTAAALISLVAKSSYLFTYQLVIILYRVQATELGTLSRSVACVHQKGQLDACQCV